MRFAPLLAVLLILLACGAPAPDPGVGPAVGSAREFLDRYVDPDGRVVRRDQGGDTVSEGQAYGMLLALAADDRARFTAIWNWTSEHLLRPDGVLSWRWRDGAVADGSSAADADLDAARALVLAGDHFDDDGLRAAGRALAVAVLDTETARTPAGLVLTAGTWVHGAPWTINPSYFAPRAARQLARATGDQRWIEVARTGTRITAGLLERYALPPDWAQVAADGTVTPRAAPDGTAPRFSFDAARIGPRLVESCEPADRTVVKDMSTELGAPLDQLRGAYSLEGSPEVDWVHPLVLVAAAATAGSDGDDAGEVKALDAAADLAAREPGYYGDAWVALGRAMLRTDLLGSCP